MATLRHSQLTVFAQSVDWHLSFIETLAANSATSEGRKPTLLTKPSSLEKLAIKQRCGSGLKRELNIQPIVLYGAWHLLPFYFR